MSRHKIALDLAALEPADDLATTHPRETAMPRKPVLSPTRIRTYLECLVEYRYAYIDRIGRFYRRARPEYSFGSTLHQVLQSFHEDGAAVPADELVARVGRSWISAGYETPEQENTFRRDAETVVRDYREAVQPRVAAGVETIALERTIRTDMGRFLLGGRVDRIDRHPDRTLEIVDYKSGRSDVTEEEVAADLAMSIYQLVVRHSYPGSRVIATIYCLRTGATASAEMDDRSATEFATDMRTLGEEIVDRDFEGIEPARIEACEWCDFRPRCERFWRMGG